MTLAGSPRCQGDWSRARCSRRLSAAVASIRPCPEAVRTSRAAIPLGRIGLHSRAVHPVEGRVSGREDLNTLVFGGLTDEDWRVARIARVNVLLVGSDGLAETGVDALRPEFCEPIEVWHPASRQVLPPIGR